MVWKIPNGNCLLRSNFGCSERKKFSVNDFSCYFHSEKVKKFLASDIFETIGEFYEIKLPQSFESNTEKMLKIIEEGSENDFLNFHQDFPVRIIKHYCRPALFSMEDYLYLNNLFAVEDGKFIKFFVSEQTCATFDAEIYTETLIDNLVFISDLLIPEKYQSFLLGEYHKDKLNS